MFSVTVRVDLEEVRVRLNKLQKGMGDRALASGLNKTVAQARTQMSRYIREDYNISAALVRERLRVSRAVRVSSAGGDIVTISANLIGNPETGGQKRSMNMIHFLERKVTLAEARRRSKAGTLNALHFQVKRSGGKKTIRGAFIGNQGRTVFARTGKSRLPIKAVRTIGVPQMFASKRNLGRITKWLEANLERIVGHEVEHYTRTVAQ
jgi:hypothetical protein